MGESHLSGKLFDAFYKLKVWKALFKKALILETSKKWSLNVQAIKYWMVYRGLGFLDVEWSVQATEYRIIYRGLGCLEVDSWFLAQPLNTSTVSQLSLFLSLPVEAVELTEGRGGRRWARSQTIRPQKSLALYKLLNTLWWRLWTFSLPCPHMHLGDKEFLVSIDI